MSGTLKEFVTRFGFEIDDHGLKALDEGIEAVKEGILHLGEVLVGEALGLYELVSHAAEAGVRLKIMSQESGIAAEKLQELQFRAKLADVSVDELNQSMNFLARNINEARNGSEQARKHFRMLGISTAELRAGTVTTDQVLERMGKTFQNLPDGPRKTGLAMEMFGRAGARMVPFLNQLGSQLDETNQKILEMSIVTDDQIEMSEEFHVNLETLKTALLGITRVIGFGLMPVASEIITEMKKWILQNRALIVQNLTEFVKGMAAALKLTIKIVDALIQSFAGFAHAVGGVRIATELLLGGFAILSGGTVLFGIGKLIEAVVTLGNSFGIANLKAAALPVAIGAAMVAIFLIMEDIYSFFNGKKSFTGDLLDKLPEIGKVFKSIFEPIFEPLVRLITMITDGFGSWPDLFRTIGELLINTLLMPLRGILAVAGGISGVIGRLTNSDKLKGFAEDAQSIADKYLRVGLGANGLEFGAGAGNEQKPEQATPNNLGISARSALDVQGAKQVTNSIELNQEYNFPPGTDPATVGDKISSSTTDGLDAVLRQTNRATSDKGVY